ncbi:MAG TPA: ATP-binding protein [Gemmatimonadales bacterium]|jgi:signal transduction histidine kinase/ActR/RegA family two-component response regulator|nr:ATP-binding protein [Gemmatimonadales bacterium]
MDTQALLDSLDLGVVVVAPDWTIAQWSAGASRITGLPADRVVDRNFWFAFPRAKGTHIEQVLQEVLADGQPQTFLAPAGVPAFPALVFETRVTRGPHNHLVLVFRQVREELSPESRSAQLLTASETERRLYTQLFSSLPLPALVLTADGQILEANAEGAKLLGVSDAVALRGRPLGDWTPPAQRVALAAALRGAVTRHQEVQLTVEVGDELVHDVHAVVVNVDAAQTSPQLLLLAVDVSREVLLQRRLVQADRLSQLGALVSGVAHELNNPLAAIAAFAELLAVAPHQADLQESAEIIRSEAMRAGRIVGTLLDFARQRPREQVAVDLAEVFDRVLALQRSAFKKARVRVTVSVPQDLPVVIGDPQELQQVVLNAVVNARQAIEGTARPGQIAIAARRTDHHVVVTVDDTGPGVPPEILDRVFEPFFTTKGDAGTGLGLAISFGLVRAMGGRMWMQNVEGGGARLAFELPMEPAPPSPAPTARFPGAARQLSVLVVDDEAAVRRGMALLAKRLGHEVTSVGDLAEAARRLGEPGARYDVLLLDVHLEEAHTGFELFEQLRLEGRGRERRVVFTTGDSISAGTRDQLEQSERPVLRKPFSLDELREMLDRVAGE